MRKYSANQHDIKEWVEAAREIQACHGIDKALQYLIGDRFYRIITDLHSSRRLMRIIDEERRKSDYRPIGITTYRNRTLVTDMEQLYLKEAEIMSEIMEKTEEFAAFIHKVFGDREIRNYFKSNPFLGAASEEEYGYLLSRGMIHRTLDTEINDALAYGEMMKYFGIA